MPRTALDLITASLKRLGVLSGIETPSADLAEDGLERLNDLIETWSTESLTLWTEITIGGVPLPTVLPPGRAGYTVGPGGEINTPQRPSVIASVSWLLTGSTPAITEYKLEPMLRQEWENEQVKLLATTQATKYYYQPDWPLGLLYFWPRPSVSFSVWVYVPVPFTGFPTLTSPVDLPPGYYRALRDNLALELAPELGRPVENSLLVSAYDALAQLKRTNFAPHALTLPQALWGLDHGRPYDWRTDE
jgi:hypothetical protein